MSEETLKVLEMVAEGKITPEEGARLLEALGASQRRGGGSEPGECCSPKLDFGFLGDLCAQLRSSLFEGKGAVHQAWRRHRFGGFPELQDYPIRVPLPEGLSRCSLHLETRAGKLSLKGTMTEGQLLAGGLRRGAEEPLFVGEVRDGVQEVRVRQLFGRCRLRASPEVTYRLSVSNAAAESTLRLQLLRVDELELQNHAGSVRIALGEELERTRVSIENNAGSVRLSVPRTHALRIRRSASLSSDNLGRYDLPLVDGAATSPDWDSNPRRVEVTLSQNVGSFHLDWRSSGRDADFDNEADSDDDSP